MIITRRWLEEFINISNISTDEICKTLNSIGLEVDSVEKKSIASKVVVAKVLSKEKHPDADKLNVCQVDIGEKIQQIVCGAKNVDAGQTVAVATLGCDLGNDFIIKEAAYMLRAISNGTRLQVIASLSEMEEMSVSQLQEQLKCEQSLLSHHLTDMRAKGVLNCRREGKNCYYSLKNKQIIQILNCINSCNCN